MDAKIMQNQVLLSKKIQQQQKAPGWTLPPGATQG
jgi:hypothetical protein